MKKIFAVILVLAVLFAFASCGKKVEYKKIGETPSITSAEDTTEPTKEVTENNGDENVNPDDFDVTEEEESESSSTTKANSNNTTPTRPQSTQVHNTTTTTTIAPSTTEVPTTQAQPEPSQTQEDVMFG